MNPEQTKKILQLLETEEQEITQRLAEFASKNPAVAGDFEPSMPENEASDEESYTNASTEFHTDVVLEQQLEARLDEIRLAKGRIATQTFGSCETCGNTIEFERLEAFPTATFCKNCAQTQK